MTLYIGTLTTTVFVSLWLMKFSQVGVRDLVVVGLLVGSVYLAVVDPSTRDKFADLAQFGLGGYLGQMVPRRGVE